MTATLNAGLMSFMAHGTAHNTAHGTAHGTMLPIGGAALESYGFAGFPGNPLLASALIETRSAVLLQRRPAVLGGTGDTGGARPPWGSDPNPLPALESPARLIELGAAQRATVTGFELLSSLGFSADAATQSARLFIRGGPTIATIRRPDRALFEAQLEMVDNEAEIRDRRYPEILTQVAPPIALYASVVNLRAERHRRTMELLNLAIALANTVVMRFKHALSCPRPSEYSGVIQPLIEAPPHPAYPAGHACEGHTIASVLAALVPGLAGSDVEAMLRSVALRIAHNRVVAGLHFPVDNLAGRLLGDAVADHFLAACRGGPVTSAVFDPTGHAATALEALEAHARYGGPGCSGVAAGPISFNPLLNQLWTAAAAEWS